MTLKKHINIAFDQIIINQDIRFFEFWKEIDKTVNFPNSFDLNKPNVYKRIIKSFYLSKYYLNNSQTETITYILVSRENVFPGISIKVFYANNFWKFNFFSLCRKGFLDRKSYFLLT